MKLKAEALGSKMDDAEFEQVYSAVAGAEIADSFSRGTRIARIFVVLSNR